jgi:hypothetical protein
MSEVLNRSRVNLRLDCRSWASVSADKNGRAQQPQSNRDPFLTTVVTSSLLYAGCINKSSAVIRVLELFSAGNK